MTIIAENWAWDAGVGSPEERLALVVLAEFADRNHLVDIPFDGFTYYCILRNGEVEPLLRSLEENGFIKIHGISHLGIYVELKVSRGEDEE